MWFLLQKRCLIKILKITSTCLRCVCITHFPVLQLLYMGWISLPPSHCSILLWELFLRRLWILYFLFFSLALIDWRVIFSRVPLGTSLRRAQCLKAWNRCEDLMQSCRIISGLLGSLPCNHLNGLPRVVSALGICIKKPTGNRISITACFPFSKSHIFGERISPFLCQNKCCACYSISVFTGGFQSEEWQLSDINRLNVWWLNRFSIAFHSLTMIWK